MSKANTDNHVGVLSRSLIDAKELDGIDYPMEKIALKSQSDHSDSGIGKMLPGHLIYYLKMKL